MAETTYLEELIQILHRLSEDEVEKFKLELIRRDRKHVFIGEAKEKNVYAMIERMLREYPGEAARIAAASVYAIHRPDLAGKIYDIVAKGSSAMAKTTYLEELMHILHRLSEDEVEKFKLELIKRDHKGFFTGEAKEENVQAMIKLMLKEYPGKTARIAAASMYAIQRPDLAREIYDIVAKESLDVSHRQSSALRSIDIFMDRKPKTSQFASTKEGGERTRIYLKSCLEQTDQDPTLEYITTEGRKDRIWSDIAKTAAGPSGIKTEVRIDFDSSEECLMCGFLSWRTHQGKIRPKIVQDPERNCETYRLNITEAGSVHCAITDLIFDVREAVTITYHFDSWSDRKDDVKKADMTVAGPLFNIEANPVEAVAAVWFPHVLCLAGIPFSRVYIAHFVDKGMILEKPDTLKGDHAVLHNPRFSPCGVVLKRPLFKRKIKVHAIVLLYQKRKVPNSTFHLYLLPNDSSLKKAVDDCENMFPCSPSMRLPKPPSTKFPLELGSCFFVETAHHVQVCPKELVLNYLHADMEQQYVELYTQHMENELYLNVMEKKKDKLVWTTCVRRGELMLDTVECHQESMRDSPETLSSLEDRNLLGACQGAESTSMTSERDELHFIDKHREELIQRTTDVEAVLDRLHGHVLTEDQYQKISSRNVHSEKMRELYRLMPSWNKYCKDQLYKALEAKHPYLIDEIKRRPSLTEERDAPENVAASSV